MEFSDEYQLLWRGHKGVVAVVRNYLVDGTRYRQVPIVLDNEKMGSLSMRFAVLGYEDGNPRIIVSRAFMNMSRKSRECVLWHEMGHVHHEHMLDADCRDQDDQRTQRIGALQSGGVLETEKEADLFAARQVGPERYRDHLREMLRTRPHGDGLNNTGALELQRRIDLMTDLINAGHTEV